MEIKTNFELGETAFFMQDKKIIEGKIIEAIINKGLNNTSISYVIEYKNKYNCNSFKDTVWEKLCFKSKKDLCNHLICESE